MPHQFAKYLSSLLGTLLVTLAYAWVVQGQAARGLLTGPAAGELAGRTILVMIAGVVVLNIALQVAVMAARWLAGQEIEWAEDERDRLIELRAINLAFSLFGAGFLAALVALALGWAPALVLHLVAGAMLGAGMAADVMRLRLYRRGF